jgi:CRISPR type IV-associated protein Csf1
MTASELVCNQAGLKPLGAIGPTPVSCVTCGRAIRPGEQQSKFNPSSSFTLGPELCARDSSNFVCGYCVHLTNQDLMLKTQLVCITRSVIIPAARLAHKKWLLLNPPDPPFVFLQTDSQLPHMIWRTPLAVSRDFWYVRLGSRLLTVRLAVVRRALERFEGAIARFVRASKPKRVPRHPFGSLDFELRDPFAWKIRSDIRPFLADGDLDFILGLRPGEYWALAILTSKTELENPTGYAIEYSRNTQTAIARGGARRSGYR